MLIMLFWSITIRLALHAFGVQRQHFAAYLGKINIIGTIGVIAALLINDTVCFISGKLDRSHGIEAGDIIVVDHVAEHCVELIQRVVLHQIDISISD